MKLKILVSLIVVAIIGFVFFKMWQRQIRIQAGGVLNDVNAVWAVQGPFENGAESAKAMTLATAAVRGTESIKVPSTADALIKHAVSYDSQPQKWESLRQYSLSGANGQKFEENLAIAEKLGAIVKTTTKH